MMLSKICDAGGFRIRKAVAAHGRRALKGRDSCTDCDSVPSTLTNIAYLQGFYTNCRQAQEEEDMSKDSEGKHVDTSGMTEVGCTNSKHRDSR